MFKKLTSLMSKFFDDHALIAVILFAVLSPLLFVIFPCVWLATWLGEIFKLPEVITTLLAFLFIGLIAYVFIHSSGAGDTGCIDRGGMYSSGC
jgi:hypothetical protein